ncbi:hypothetical protein Taro_014800 [Colocasia esculenta]|uniref:Uncharacterized protein n=1 Tax=Colocasia esculenta TaxID=4460 RepID=A0A843UMW9_COLES|nr:hypothetical protein [Colocasia esculenta]
MICSLLRDRSPSDSYFFCRVDTGRKPNCEGYGSICYDPRFVGGDGVMFYFHGAKDGDFALVSDDQLHINGHFIGTRPPGRSRDFTWVQALAIMFESHSLEVAARTVATWNDKVDALTLRWDGKEIAVPVGTETEDGYWRVVTGEGREVVVERTDAANSARLRVAGLVEIDVKVRPIGEEEDRVHGYHLPPGDAFAHLEMQFRFASLTDGVEGVLGQTYRPGYLSPVKKGVAMPMMGGEDKYRVSSFLSTGCVACCFSLPAAPAETHNGAVQRQLPSPVAHDGKSDDDLTHINENGLEYHFLGDAKGRKSQIGWDTYLRTDKGGVMLDHITHARRRVGPGWAGTRDDARDRSPSARSLSCFLSATALLRSGVADNASGLRRCVVFRR